MGTLNFSEVVGSANPSKNLINLLRGWPHPSLLPIRLVEKGSQRVFESPAASTPALLYGPDNGNHKLLVNLASWLTRFFNPCAPVTEHRLCITGGASQGLACILQVFTDPVYTRNVWFVSPAYMLAFRIFEDSALKLRAVPEDDQGIDIEYLRRELKKSEEQAKAQGNGEPIKPPRPWAKVYRHVIYAVPTFSNPSFKTMTLKRREELVRLAREYDMLVITDDVYDFLQWPASLSAQTQSIEKAVLPRVVDVDRYLDGGTERDGADGFGNSVSNGTFSKICGPGLRTGWCEGTEKLAFGVSQTGSSRSGGAPSQLTATFLAETLETGELQRHVYDTLQPAYGRRYRKMIAAIHEELMPLGVRLPQTDRDIVGGYFIWLTLPSPLKGSVLAQRAKEEENVVVAQGEMFQVPGDCSSPGTRFDNHLRICFAWEEEEMLAEGIRRLSRVIGRMRDEHEGGRQEAKTAVATDGSAQDFW